MDIIWLTRICGDSCRPPKLGHCRDGGNQGRTRFVPLSAENFAGRAEIPPDWNIAEMLALVEWVEHQHWIYETVLPDEWLKLNSRFRLKSRLRYSGWIFSQL